MGTQYQPDGLPNITGNIPASETVYSSGFTPPSYGAFYRSNANVVSGSSTNDVFDNDFWNFNASRMRNSQNVQIYGVSEWVQPKNVSVLPIIKY